MQYWHILTLETGPVAGAGHAMLTYPVLRLWPESTIPVTPAMMAAAPITAAEMTMGRDRDWVWSTTTPARGGPAMMSCVCIKYKIKKTGDKKNKCSIVLCQCQVLQHVIVYLGAPRAPWGRRPRRRRRRDSRGQASPPAPGWRSPPPRLRSHTLISKS